MRKGNSKIFQSGSITRLMLLIGCLILFLRFRSQAMMKPQTILSNGLSQGLNDTNVKLWQAVAYHETGGFTSPIFRENNNFFGMKRPTIRQTTAIGENRGHAVFASLEKSVEDILLYLKARDYKQVNTPEELVKWMQGKGYFTDTYDNYLRGVKNGLTKV